MMMMAAGPKRWCSGFREQSLKGRREGEQKSERIAGSTNDRENRSFLLSLCDVSGAVVVLPHSFGSHSSFPSLDIREYEE
jgi:hypothetical protein